MKKIHMRTKVLLFCLGSTLIALLLQTLLFENTSARLIYNQAKEESFHSLQNMQNDIYSYVKDMESGLIKVYNEKEFVKSLRSGETAQELRETYYRLAYSLGTANFTSQDGVVALYLYTADHEIISTYRRAVTPKHHYETDIYEEEEQQNAGIVRAYAESDDATMLISSYYNPYRETDLMRFVLKIYNNSNLQDKLGYLVCDTDTKVVRGMMEKYSVSQEMFMWLQPTGDRPIVSVGSLEGQDLKDYEEAAQQIGKGAGETLTASKRVLFQVPQERYNLNAYSLMPQSLLAQNQKTLTRNLLLIACIMIAAATLLNMFVSKSLTKPLVRLTETMKRIRKGETQLRAQVTNQDEIGELAQNFNEMLDEMEVLLRREYEAKLMVNRAEYRALQAQINPHFLYNTLDTMSSIAQIQNCPQVSGLSQSLSNIFRYSLDMKHPCSTVAQEIVHLKNYIYVMDMRMMDHVDYQFSIDDQALSATLPRITIQPLVENALNHGLRNKRGEKRIRVKAQIRDGDLEITVEDNGVGISGEKIRQILGEEPAKGEGEGGTSIGLANIRGRIRLLYGERAVMEVLSREGEGTRISLRIPRLKMEEVTSWQGTKY